jgi:hypothetical protein
MSGLAQKADVRRANRHVRKGPEVEVTSALDEPEYLEKANQKPDVSR